MSTDTTGTAVRHSITVEAPLEKAFSVFTDDIGSWWPPEHHLGPVAEMVFEPRDGGRIYDRMTDGSEIYWARVLAYEPPTRLVFSWDVSPAWQIETDPRRTSEVEVRFIAEGPSSTRVDLEHRHIERHGEGWEQVRDAVDSDGGWPLGLRRFHERLTS
jgi:uncharacterized protein YndB with AHSA1/START domain